MRKVNFLFVFIIAMLFVACDKDDSMDQFIPVTESEKKLGESKNSERSALEVDFDSTLVEADVSSNVKLEMYGTYLEREKKWVFSADLMNETESSRSLMTSGAEIKVDGIVADEIREGEYSVSCDKPEGTATFNIEISHNLIGTQNYEITASNIVGKVEEATVSADKQDVFIRWQDLGASHYVVRRRLLRGLDDLFGRFTKRLDRAYEGTSKTYNYNLVTKAPRPRYDRGVTHVRLHVTPIYVLKNMDNLHPDSFIKITGRNSEYFKHEIVR